MLFLITLLACSPTPAPDVAEAGGVVDLTVALAPPEQGYQVVTEPFEVPPNTEKRVCSVVRLDAHADETLVWASQFESQSSVGSHHMNVLLGTFSFLDAALGEGASEAALGFGPGTYDCDDLPLMEQAFTFFPSQRSNQRITLPPGVAAPLSAPLLLIFDHHYVNGSLDTLRVNGALNFQTVDSGEVEQVASLLFDDIHDLAVEPYSRASVTSTCVVDRAVDVALVSTHTHEWGECATLRGYDGAEDVVEADPFYVNRSWDTPPILHFQPGTFHLEPGDGIQWSCHYYNDRDTPLVNNGTADGEMCVFAAAVYPAPFGVQEVEDIVASQDVAQLGSLIGEVLGACDRTVDTPAPDDGGDDAPACSELDQTESNVLY